VTVLTTAKVGTGLTAVVPIEGVLVPLAVTGLVLGWRRRRARGALAAAALLFTLVQTVALVAAPARTVVPYIYPGAARGTGGRELSDGQVRAAVAAARRCPPRVPYSGVPFLAFIAHRPVPAGQPDGFLPPHSSSLRAVKAQILADTPRCP
ncbi:MAG: hypothetical protein JWN32_593, partial [Solirubrobacterales bacterium]|nr:hypothetical protein [Solirubrobacterales bacterium]